MLGFDKFLIEMSIQDAMDTLGVENGFDAAALKTAFRRASSKNHPDKGGSTAAMQKVNQAYDMLKSNVGHVGREAEMNERFKVWRELAAVVRKDLVKNMDVKAYTKHFEKLFGEEFVMVITKVYPDDAELKRLEGLRHSSVPHYVYFNVEWNNHDRTKVFQLDVSVGMANLMGAGGLASPGTTYQMGVSTFAYINGRKVKITKRDFTHTAKKSVFNKPETVFPKAKLIKKKQTKFKKSDMLSALKAEIRAETSGEYFFIPLKGGDKYLAIYRTTMMRKGLWSLNGIWFKKSKYSWSRDKAIDFGFYSFMEDENTLNVFRKVKNMDVKKVEKFIKSEYEKAKS